MSDVPLGFGGFNLHDLLGKIPGGSEIQSLKTDYDKFVDTVDNLTNLVKQYGWIPGANALVGPLEILDHSLQLAKTLIDHVP